MKRLINLGIVLGIVLIINACQKEEFNPTANSWAKTSQAVDYTVPDPGTVFEPAPPTRSGSNYSPSTIFEAAPGGGTTTLGDVPTSPYPSGPDYETTDLPDLPSDINERHFTIHWQYEKPSDKKWPMIETMAEEGARTVFGIPNLCPYDDCEEAIGQAVANLQVQANILCQDLYACIACCIDGFVVYAMVVAFHECGIIAPPADF